MVVIQFCEYTKNTEFYALGKVNFIVCQLDLKKTDLEKCLGRANPESFHEPLVLVW